MKKIKKSRMIPYDNNYLLDSFENTMYRMKVDVWEAQLDCRYCSYHSERYCLAVYPQDCPPIRRNINSLEAHIFGMD